ncbi:7 transmembrane receptor (rhodopsin family) domain-containing protein [Ditylenchus destructor]|uniref:7 transmembrane receptor (Rhodopsin family) domain-containing protein n=1 Tax=Ditylenchus destructor TaxID=166010 RepID=A0AAD4R3Q7_9BILA|nr:7 transmembrane receptor (rhodopsin family) domain-containing protein [Ditylenchus destructor]
MRETPWPSTVANVAVSQPVPTVNLVYFSSNATADIDANWKQEWYMLALVLMPLACIVGNSLVVAAVWTTRALQTPTNYLLVSLACADLLVGTAVMPFNIYMAVNGLHWHLPPVLCYIYCVLDVAASTSSIIHLVLISIDRLVAATKPAEYKTPKHKRRVYISIGFAWIFSICLSLPLVTGFNTSTRHFLMHEHHCGIYSPMYMLCSSLFAFYLPCLIMSITYGYIFYTLKKRLRAIQLQEMAGGQFLGFGADVGNITTSAIETVIGIEPKNRNMISWEKPLLKKIEETAAEHASSLNDSEREQLQTILEAVHPNSSGSGSQGEPPSQDGYTNQMVDEDRPSSVMLEAITLRQQNSETNCSSLALEVPKPSHCFPTRMATRRFSDAIHSTILRTTGDRSAKNGQRVSIIIGDYDEHKESKNGFDKSRNSIRRHSYQPPGSAKVTEEEGDKNRLKPTNMRGNRAMRRLSEIISDWERPSRASLSQMRETRATKLVATVMGVFLVCWLPYFTLNMFKVYRLFSNNWPPHLEGLFHWFSALGYLNSSLNFIIYSAINKKFRSSFRRLVGLRRHHSTHKWRPGAAKTGKSTVVIGRKRKANRKPTAIEHSGILSNSGRSNNNNIMEIEDCKTASATSKRTKTSAGKKSGCGCTSFPKTSGGPLNLLHRHLSLKKPEIIIDEVTVSPNNISISADGYTTYRQSSDDCLDNLRRSSSEVIGGVIFPNNHDSRRGSGMSNSSASLQLHDMHEIARQSYQEGEIFV